MPSLIDCLGRLQRTHVVIDGKPVARESLSQEGVTPNERIQRNVDTKAYFDALREHATNHYKDNYGNAADISGAHRTTVEDLLSHNRSERQDILDQAGHDSTAAPTVEQQAPKLRLKLDKGRAGFIDPPTLAEVHDFGKKVYQKGMDFAKWSGEMVRHLGEKVKGHLQSIWNEITNSSEAGSVGDTKGGINLSGERTDTRAARQAKAEPVLEPKSETEGEKLTGISKEAIERQRIALEADAIERQKQIDFGAAADRAKKIVKNDAGAPRALVEGLKNKMRALNPEETPLLIHRMEEVDAEVAASLAAERSATTASATEAAQARLAAAREEYDSTVETIQNATAKSGAGLNSLKMLLDRNFTPARMEAEVRAVNKNRGLFKEEMQAKIDEAHAASERLAALDKKLADARAKTVENKVDPVYNSILRENLTAAKETAKAGKSLTEYLDDAAAKARQRIIDRRGRLQITVDPLNVAGLVDEAIIGASHVAHGLKDFKEWSKAMVEDFGERISPYLDQLWQRARQYHDAHAKLFNVEEKPTSESILAKAKGAVLNAKSVYDLARVKINEGIEGSDNVMRAVHEDLKTIHPDVTLRQVKEAFTDYGHEKIPSQEADRIKLREYRRLEQLALGIEDSLKGIEPSRSGMRRDKPTQAIREKMKELRRAMKDAGFTTTTEEGKLASVNQARETALENQIADLEKEIATGEKTPSGTPVADNARVTELKARRDKLKAEAQAIQDAKPEVIEAKKRAEIESKQNALLKQIKDLKEKLAGKIKAKAADLINRPADPELESMMQDRDKLRKQLANSRKKSDAQKHAEAQQRQLNSLNDRIDERLAKLSVGDTLSGASKPKINRPFSPELEKAQQELDKVNEQMAAARKAPPKTEAEQLAADLARIKTVLRKNLTAIKDRNAAKDYTPRVKPEPKTDAEIDKLRTEINKERTLWKNGLMADQHAQRTFFQKLTGRIASFNRANVLAHLSVIEHLAGAALENIATRPMGTAVAQLFRFNRTLNAIRKKAVYEGHLGGEVANLRGIIGSSRAVWDKLRTGKSQLDWLNGDGKVYPKEFLEQVANTHGAIKEPIRQGIYARSLELNFKAAREIGLHPETDEILRTILQKEAFDNANADIFMGDSFLTKALHNNVASYLRGQKMDSGLAKFTADVLDVLFPVVNVSTNIAIRKFRLLAGLPESIIRIGVAAKKGELANRAELLSARDAELITKSFKYGAFGLGLSLYAWNHADQFGGIYSLGPQAPKNEKVPQGDINVNGYHISRHFLHGPVGGHLNMVADAKRLYEKEMKKDPQNKWGALTEAGFFGLMSGAANLPAFANLGRWASPFKSAGMKAGELVRNMFISGAIQDIAERTDQKRSPKNFTDEIKVGVPVWRKTVPAGKDKSATPTTSLIRTGF